MRPKRIFQNMLRILEFHVLDLRTELSVISQISEKVILLLTEILFRFVSAC